MTKAKASEKPAQRKRASGYNASFCELLIAHMAEGQPFETFAAKLKKCSRRTLYRWVEQFPEFAEAKAIGLEKGYDFWFRMGVAGATGQARRLVSETPKTFVDSNGVEQPVLDPKGQPVMVKRYAPAHFNAAVWIFTMKNRFGWRDKVELMDEENYEGIAFHDGEKVWLKSE